MDIDSFEHAGIQVRIVVDEEALNPRTDYDQLAILTQLGSGYASPGDSQDQDERIVNAWEHPTGRRSYGYSKGHLYGGDETLVERYARAFLGAVAVGWWDDGHSSSRIFGYIAAEQMAKGWGESPWTADDAQRVVDGELDEYRMYCEGEVYGYIVADGESDEESCWGFFGLDYCTSEARDAADHIARRLSAHAAATARAEELAIERAELDPVMA